MVKYKEISSKKSPPLNGGSHHTGFIIFRARLVTVTSVTITASKKVAVDMPYVSKYLQNQQHGTGIICD